MRIPTRVSPGQRREQPWRRALRWPVLIVFLLLPACGDDEPTQPAGSTQEQVESGLNDLASFSQNIESDPGAQLAAQYVGYLLDTLPLPAVTTGNPVALLRLPGPLRFLGQALQKAGSTSPRHVAALQGTGTYDRDASSTAGPFPGWVLVDAGNPPDGYIFRFALDDDIGYYNAMGAFVPVQGAFRLLHVQVDENGTLDPADDIVTAFVLEIAASANEGTAPTIVRLGLNLTLDASRQVQHLTLGDPAADRVSDPGAAFVGFHILAVDISTSTAATGVLVQVYNAILGYAVRLQVDVDGDIQADHPNSVSLDFAYGRTRNPQTPPWRIELLLDNFTLPTGATDYVADVHGQLSFRSAVFATLSGDTTEVPVDLDGDGTPDDTCINIDITFIDHPEESGNICETLAALNQLLRPTLNALVAPRAH